MKELIDKDLLKEELNTRIEVLSIPGFSDNPLMVGEKSAYLSILSFLDTLEVKEVDEQKERMSECPYRQVGCKMYEGKILECNGACDWVVDHLNFKELLKQRKENKHGSTRENLFNKKFIG